MSISIGRSMTVALALSLVPGCASKVYEHPALAAAGSPSAQLTVLRKDEAAGSGVPLVVCLDGENLVRLWTGSYAVVDVKPGNRLLTVEHPSTMETVSEAPIVLDPDTEHHVLVAVSHIGFNVGVGVAVSSDGATSTSVGAGAEPVQQLFAITEEEALTLMSAYDRIE